MFRRLLLVAALGTALACTKSESKAERQTPAAPSTIEPEGTAPAPAKKGPDSSYKLTLEPPSPVAAGAEAVARIRVIPGAGYKMNKDFPTKLTLKPPAGVKVAKAEMVLADAEAFDERQLVFAVKATPASAGEYTVDGSLKFAVCTDATCDPKREKVSIKVAAQ